MKIVLIFILAGLSGTSLFAQQTVSSTGGNASGSGGKVSYSIGQIAYTTIIDVSNGSLSQGVQQPFEISVVTALGEAKDITLAFSVYPNPASEFLTLKFNGAIESHCLASLYDLNGNLLQVIKVEFPETFIAMQNHLPGSYILKITRGNKEVKTFKIIKK